MYTVLEHLLSGGLETSQLVAAETNSFTIPKLKESTTYTICMSAVIRGKEGSPTLLTAKTCEYGTTGWGQEHLSHISMGLSLPRGYDGR